MSQAADTSNNSLPHYNKEQAPTEIDNDDGKGEKRSSKNPNNPQPASSGGSGSNVKEFPQQQKQNFININQIFKEFDNKIKENKIAEGEFAELKKLVNDFHKQG